MNYGFVYETVNHINGKKYIGKHKRNQDPNDPDDSWYLGSSKYLLRSIEKYGIENFSRRIICECNSEEELQEHEKYYIKYYDAVHSPDYYNLVEDANPPKSKIGRPGTMTCRKFTPEHCRKIAESNSGRHHSVETRLKMSKSHIGQIRAKETREKISKGLTGRQVPYKPHNPDHTAKIASANKGKIRSKETREKMRESASKRIYHKCCSICGCDFIGYSSRSKYCKICKEVSV